MASASAVNAYQQRAEVERLGRLTQSQHLAALSAALMASNPDEAARKALEAYQASPTRETRSQVLSTAFSRQRETSASGHRVATGNGVIGVAGERGVQIYDSTTLAPITDLPTNGTAYGLAFAADGRIAVSDPSGRVTLRSGPHGEPEVLRESGDQTSLVFTEDGRELVAGGQIWDLGTRELRAELPIGPVPRRLDVLGDTLAVYGHDLVTLWNLKTAKQIGGFTITGRISDLKLLAGDTAVVGDMDGQLQLWSTSSGRQLRDLGTTTRSPVRLDTNADRTVLAASGLGYYEIRLWDVVRWTSLPPLRMERLEQSLAFTPDGRLVVLTDSSLRMWPRGSVPMTSGHAVRALAVDRDGTMLTFDNGGFIERRDVGMNRVSRIATGAANSFTAAFSQDAKLVATSGNDGTSLRDAASGQALSKLTAENGETPRALAFAGNEVAALSGAHSTAVWTVRPEPTPEQVRGFLDGVPTAVAFGRSDHEIVIGSEEGIVAVQDTKTWATKGLGKVHDDAVRAFALSPDKRVLATGGDDGLITLWNTSTWQRIGELRGHTSGVTALGFSPDSARLASGGTDKNVVVWDLQERSVWATLTGHSDVVTHVVWMPDSRSVVSAGPDALLVWPLDVETALRALS